jgi:N utilization substance protein A
MVRVASFSDDSDDFLAALFAEEVPEIAAGTVEIRAIARIPGRRVKVAVRSDDPEMDPVGACVGPKGSRVQRIVERLGGERIDLFPWSDTPERLIRLALAPAMISSVELDPSAHSALVRVKKDQVQTAVGPRGENIELAGRIAGWTLNIEIVRNEDAA